jgi:hypothetical protein
LGGLPAFALPVIAAVSIVAFMLAAVALVLSLVR